MNSIQAVWELLLKTISLFNGKNSSSKEANLSNSLPDLKNVSPALPVPKPPLVSTQIKPNREKKY